MESQTTLPHKAMTIGRVMEAQQLPILTPAYEIELGHAKSGSDHVLIIKSIKVRGDDLSLAIAELKAGLATVQELI